METNHRPPEGWLAKRIDEIADVRFSSVDKNIVQGEVPVRLCNYMEVWKNPYIHRGLNFMAGSATKEEVEKFGLRPGDVLLTKDSETKEEIAEPSVVREEIENLVLGYHLALIRPDERYAHGLFLAGQLRLPQFRAQFIRAASGVTRYGLGLDEVRSAIVWVPSVERQRRIGMMVQSTHDAHEATRAVIAQMRRVKAALLQDLLANGLPGHHTKYQTDKRIGRIPSDWRVVPLDHLIEPGRPICYGILMPGRGYPGGVPVIKVKDLKDGQIDETNLLLTSPELDDEYSRSRLSAGDILLTIRGTTGRVAIVPATLNNANITQDTARVSIRDPITRDYVYYALQGHVLQRQIRDHTIGQAVKGINIEEVRKLPISLPEENERREIVELLHRAEERLGDELAYLSQLVKSNHALSHGLLSGHIPVSCSETTTTRNRLQRKERP